MIFIYNNFILPLRNYNKYYIDKMNNNLILPPLPPSSNEEYNKEYNLKKIIQSFTEDISNIIYGDNFSVKSLNEKINKILESESSRSLEYNALSLEIPNILSNSLFKLS
jgi:hypothetical protein